MQKQLAHSADFEVTHEIPDIADAGFLTGIGKHTELITRISTVGLEPGSVDTIRNLRGWAIKFKTQDEKQDLVFNNQTVFFVLSNHPPWIDYTSAIQSRTSPTRTYSGASTLLILRVFML